MLSAYSLLVLSVTHFFYQNYLQEKFLIHVHIFYRGNIIESALNLLVVFDVLKSVRKSKLLAIVASIMTAWKTVLFCLYSLDVGQGGHTFNWFAELVVLGPALIWIVFPVYAAKVLMEDFLNTKTLRSKPSDDGNDVTDSPSPRYYLRKR